MGCDDEDAAGLRMASNRDGKRYFWQAILQPMPYPRGLWLSYLLDVLKNKKGSEVMIDVNGAR